MTSRLESVLSAIDHLNSADPTLEDGVPAARLYGERMSASLAELYPSASEPLQIAARGQHIERWLLRRDEFPAGREGYLAWRQEQARRHAVRLAALMAAEGYAAADIAAMERMVRKQGIKRDPEVQALEDAACFTFLRWYMGDFASGRDMDDLARIVAQTARKMSQQARDRALVTFDLPEAFAVLFRS